MNSQVIQSYINGDQKRGPHLSVDRETFIKMLMQARGITRHYAESQADMAEAFQSEVLIGKQNVKIKK